MPQVGDIADHDEKAPFALTIVDEQATERLRREAGDGAPAVYDFDDKRSSAVRDAIGSAFAAARAVRAAAPPARGAPPPPPRGPGPQSEDDARTPSSAFREALGAEVQIPEVSIAHLEKTGFSADGEVLLGQLVESAAGRMIIDDSAELERQAESRAVVVRDLGSGNERTLKPGAHVLSSDGARALVEKNAAEVLSSSPPPAR